jgi:hypothetical protein
MANLYAAPLSGGPCVTGMVHPAPPTSQFIAGTHVLTDSRGNVIMLLRSDTLNLAAIAGRPATVCGQLQSAVTQANGVQRLLIVTAAQPLAVPIAQPAGAGGG